MKKISIIIPTYNVAPYIKECLTSIFSQRFDNLEIVIIDDSSSDKTLKEIKKAIDGKENKTKVIIRSKNKGIASARNEGIRESTGDILVFLDGDDVLTKGSLLSRYEELKKGADFVFADAFYIKEGVRTKEKYLRDRFFNEKKDLFSSLVLENPIVTSSVMIKKNIFDKVGLFDESKDNKAEDFDLWIRVALKDFSWKFIDKPAVYYRRRKGSLSDNKIPMLEGRIYVFNQILKGNISSERKALVKRKMEVINKEIKKERALKEAKEALLDRKYNLARKKFRIFLKEDKGLKNRMINIFLWVSPSFVRKAYLDKNEGE